MGGRWLMKVLSRVSVLVLVMWWRLFSISVMLWFDWLVSVLSSGLSVVWLWGLVFWSWVS